MDSEHKVDDQALISEVNKDLRGKTEDKISSNLDQAAAERYSGQKTISPIPDELKGKAPILPLRPANPAEAGTN